MNHPHISTTSPAIAGGGRATPHRGRHTPTKHGGFSLDGDHFGRIGVSANALDFGMELSFKVGSKFLDGGGLVGGAGVAGGGEEGAVIFSREAVSVAIEDEDGVYFGKEWR